AVQPFIKPFGDIGKGQEAIGGGGFGSLEDAIEVGRGARKDIDRRNFRLRDSHTGASRSASSSSGIGVFNATALLQEFSEPVTHPLDHGVIVSDPSLNFVKPIRMRVYEPRN